jgi:antagonist of KipI
MEVTVARGGVLTTVQDQGRLGHRSAGVPVSGAVDVFALRLANLLVGNPEDAAALECTLVGPELIFSGDTTIAVGGAEFESVPTWQPIPVRAGERIAFGRCRKGCRGYIAFAGGVEGPSVLGSRSTFLRGKFGGFDGRALREADVFKVGSWTQPANSSHWHIDPRILPAYSASPTLRVTRGAHADEFDETWLEDDYKVTPQSDRMGMRLSGRKLNRAEQPELISSAVAPGTIQVPPDGQPIVLLADAQTIGGYPKLAHVISVDLALAAQVKPGDTVGFKEVSLETAHRLWHARETTLAILRQGLAQKFR